MPSRNFYRVHPQDAPSPGCGDHPEDQLSPGCAAHPRMYLSQDGRRHPQDTPIPGCVRSSPDGPPYLQMERQWMGGGHGVDFVGVRVVEILGEAARRRQRRVRTQRLNGTTSRGALDPQCFLSLGSCCSRRRREHEAAQPRSWRRWIRSFARRRSDEVPRRTEVRSLGQDEHRAALEGRRRQRRFTAIESDLYGPDIRRMQAVAPHPAVPQTPMRGSCFGAPGSDHEWL